MSIRIHTMMGYGLTDLVCGLDETITDPRINPEGWLLTPEEDQDTKYSMKNFRTYVQREMTTTKNKYHPDYSDLMIYLNYCKDNVHAYECIKHETEMGLSNVLCLIPPGLVYKWYRSDDDIDYYMSDTPESWVREYELGNFYPYTGYVDTHTGERLVGLNTEIVRSICSYVAPGGIHEDQVYELGELQQNELGCINSDEVKKRYVRDIPGHLKSFIRYMNLFTDDKVMYQLKPIIYRFWG